MNVPLELVVDNFTEVEHTPTTHALLGYELKNMAQVVTEVESTDSAVRVYNSGPQKRISPLVSMAFGISSGDRFVDDWTTRFSPVHSVYEQYWCDARTDVQKGVRWRNYVFFNPLSDDETELITFGFIDRGTFSGRFGLLNLLRPLMTWFVDREIRLDVAMVENLADKRPDIDGMKLSRFDRVLGLHRERINRIYRGEPAATNGA
jgi:vanillate O-demethylase monooxygenase subunit